MNPVPLFLIIVSLSLLLGGCGGKDESTTETKTVEEKVQEVKEEGKPEEPVAETKSQLDGVNLDKLEEREGVVYLKGSDTPYTGKATSLYENGQKTEANLKDGKRDGLIVLWHENGQKALEQKYKNGEEISAKYWNRKGDPVDSFEEAEKE